MSPSPLQALVEMLNDPELGETVLPDGTGVLLDTQGHQVLTLSKTAVFLVQQLRDGVTEIDALTEHLAAKYSVDMDTARQDISEFLANLSQMLRKEGSTEKQRVP